MWVWVTSLIYLWSYFPGFVTHWPLDYRCYPSPFSSRILWQLIRMGYKIVRRIASRFIIFIELVNVTEYARIFMEDFGQLIWFQYFRKWQQKEVHKWNSKLKKWSNKMCMAFNTNHVISDFLFVWNNTKLILRILCGFPSWETLRYVLNELNLVLFSE